MWIYDTTTAQSIELHRVDRRIWRSRRSSYPRFELFNFGSRQWVLKSDFQPGLNIDIYFSRSDPKGYIPAGIDHHEMFLYDHEECLARFIERTAVYYRNGKTRLPDETYSRLHYDLNELRTSL